MEDYIPVPAAQGVPCHPESERSVLGAMLRSHEAALLALETLHAGATSMIPPIAKSTTAMQATYRMPVAADRSGDAGRGARAAGASWSAVGGAAYLRRPEPQFVPSAANAGAYIRIVDEKIDAAQADRRLGEDQPGVLCRGTGYAATYLKRPRKSRSTTSPCARAARSSSRDPAQCCIKTFETHRAAG